MSSPVHCPFCGDEDLRPAEDGPTAWSCRSCARVFTVSLVRIDDAAIPGHFPGHVPSRPRPTAAPAAATLREGAR